MPTGKMKLWECAGCGEQIKSKKKPAGWERANIGYGTQDFCDFCGPDALNESRALKARRMIK